MLASRAPVGLACAPVQIRGSLRVLRDASTFLVEDAETVARRRIPSLAGLLEEIVRARVALGGARRVVRIERRGVAHRQIAGAARARRLGRLLGRSRLVRARLVLAWPLLRGGHGRTW